MDCSVHYRTSSSRTASSRTCTSSQLAVALHRPLHLRQDRAFIVTTQQRHVLDRERRSSRLQVLAAVKKVTEKHVVCSKTLVGKPGNEKELTALCQKIVSFSAGRMADPRSGIMEFTCSKDNYEENVFHFWERYESNKKMGLHNSTKEMATFMEKVQDLLTGPVGMALYEWKEGHIGNVCIQGGPKGEGGLDDATGAGGTGASNMKQTSAAMDLGKVRRGDEGDGFGMGLGKIGEALENFKLPWKK